MTQALGAHTNGLSPTQSVPVVRMGVLLVNVITVAQTPSCLLAMQPMGAGHANVSSRAHNVLVVHVGVLLANVRCWGSAGKPISDDANNGAT